MIMIICSCCCFRWCCINSCCTCSSGSCCFRDRCCSSSCCSRSRCIMQARFQWWEIQWMENLKIFSFRLHSLVIELAIRSFMPITDQIHELVTSSDINCWFCKSASWSGPFCFWCLSCDCIAYLEILHSITVIFLMPVRLVLGTYVTVAVLLIACKINRITIILCVEGKMFYFRSAKLTTRP